MPSSPSPPAASPTPPERRPSLGAAGGKSFKTRMGSMGSLLRRSSSGIIAAAAFRDRERDSSPARSASATPRASGEERRRGVSPRASQEQLKLQTAPTVLSPPAQGPEHTLPSPVAESPAREAEAADEERVPVGPSKLAETTTAETESEPAPVAAKDVPVPQQAEEAKKEEMNPEATGTIVPSPISPRFVPLHEQTTPFFHAEPDTMSNDAKSTHSEDKVERLPTPEPAPAPTPAPAPAPAPAQHEISQEGTPEPVKKDLEPTPVPILVQEQPATPEPSTPNEEPRGRALHVQEPVPTPAPSIPEPQAAPSIHAPEPTHYTSEFEHPPFVPESLPAPEYATTASTPSVSDRSLPEPEPARAPERDAPRDPPMPVPQLYSPPNEHSNYAIPMPVPQATSPVDHARMPHHDIPSIPSDSPSTPRAQPMPMPAIVIAAPEPAKPAPAAEHARGHLDPHACGPDAPHSHKDGDVHINGTGTLTMKISRASLRAAQAAPDGAAGVVAVVRAEGDNLVVQAPENVSVKWEDPFADPPTPTSPELFSPTRPNQGGDSSYHPVIPVTMPLPSMNELIKPSSIKTVPSNHSTNGNLHAPHETNERIPLLKRPMPEPHANLDLISNSLPSSSTVVNVSSSSEPAPEALGWTSHILPDGTLYFSHARLALVADADLRAPRVLGALAAFLDRKVPDGSSLPAGSENSWEVWLREVTKRGKRDIEFERAWVNHTERVLLTRAPTAIGTPNEADTDHMDMEYRYWSYIEAHPAHLKLPESAVREARDALSWTYTDVLLPSSRPAPPPFTQAECQELTSLLAAHPAGVVHTRVIARIHLRMAQWRQETFRPLRALPRDVGKHGGVARRSHSSMGRAAIDFVIGFLCLGIPFLFMDRPHSRRMDLESGISLSSPAPMLMIGACSCLVAAIILSASVTFISLPGVDDVARIAALLAILCSTASMASTVLALFRYKADIERAPFASGEGFVFLTRRSILMSLPLVFLAWAVIAFVTGISVYSFRGIALTVPGLKFGVATQWAVACALGGLIGMLIISALFVR